MDIRQNSMVFGKTRKDKFRVENLLGRGNFGNVFRITSENRDEFALKTLDTSIVDEEGLGTLLNEGEMSMTVDHPNVIKVVFFHDGKKYPELPVYIIMELARDGSLRNLLEIHKKENSLFTNNQLQKFFLDLANGMQEINKKMVHRDIKPENILIMNGQLKISDFGLSKIINEATRTLTFRHMNTPLYCAPESWSGNQGSISGDIYSMGIVFFELATLNYPYEIPKKSFDLDNIRLAHQTEKIKNIEFFNPGIRKHLSQIIQRMLLKNPRNRSENWEEIINYLYN